MNIQEEKEICDDVCPKCGSREIQFHFGKYCQDCLYCFACEGKGCAACDDTKYPGSAIEAAVLAQYQ
jgi:hypothetical protein